MDHESKKHTRLFLLCLYVLGSCIFICLLCSLSTAAAGVEQESFWLLRNNSLTFQDFTRFARGKFNDFTDSQLELDSFHNHYIYSPGNGENSCGQVGLFYISSDNITAEQEAVNYYLDSRADNYQQQEYKIQADTEQLMVKGLFFGNALFSDLHKDLSGNHLSALNEVNLNYRLKVITDGRLEKRNYDGEVEIDSPFKFMDGYRQLTVSRKGESRIRGLLVDLGVSGSIFFSEREINYELLLNNILGYVTWENVYVREVKAGDGVYYYKDFSKSPPPFLQLGFNIQEIQKGCFTEGMLSAGIDILAQKSYPYLRYYFDGVSPAVAVGTYGSLFSLSFDHEYLSLQLKGDNLNFMQAENFVLGLELGFSF